MLVRLDEYTKQEQEAKVETFVVVMENGTRFRFRQEIDYTLSVLRIAGQTSVDTITITPVVSNKVILA